MSRDGVRNARETVGGLEWTPPSKERMGIRARNNNNNNASLKSEGKDEEEDRKSSGRSTGTIITTVIINRDGVNCRKFVMKCRACWE